MPAVEVANPTIAPPARDPAASQAWIDAVLAAQPDPGDPFAAIDACVAAEMDEAGVAGASIAIAQDGAVVYARGYGVRHREQGGAIETDTRFRIGSTTKMMTAAALMALVEDGRIELHAPITRYLPELTLPAPWDAAAITPHHLLSHTSGLSESYRLHRFDLFDAVPLATWARDLLPLTPLAAPPGTFWNYSNPGFSLAGYLVERVAGQRLAEFAAERIWRPAGMTRTTLSPSEAMADDGFAYGHDGSRRLAPTDLPADVLGPAGMAFSTPTDLVRWASLLMAGGGGVLSEASVAAMQTPHAATHWSPWEQYGYGIFVTSYRDRDDAQRLVAVHDHAGNTTGWASELAWVTERGLAVSILDNSARSLGNARQCALRVLGGVVPRPTGGQTTNPDTWGRFVGTYAEMNQALWDSTIRIRRQGDRLVMQRVEAGTELPLVNAYGHTFAVDADGDGRADSSNPAQRLTFGPLGEDGTPGWLRNRTQVSQRLGELPEAIALSSTGCAPVTLTPSIDLPRLALLPSGLVPPGTERLADLPLRQDDPADPTTAGLKHDVHVRGAAGLFTVRLDLRPGDDAGLYLLGDRDGDGAFAYPEEVVDVGWEGQGYRLMTVTERLPAGRYQVWVHGLAVRGAGRTAALEIRLVDGDHLRVEGAPAGARAGERVAARVCVARAPELREPLMGYVALEYGSPPRRARIPVTWTPADDAPIFMPAALGGGPLR